MIHPPSADFLRDGVPEALLPPEALLLVALLLGRRPEAVEVSLRPLDGPDEIGLLHPCRADSHLPRDVADLLHVRHDAPPSSRRFPFAPRPNSYTVYTFVPGVANP